MVRGLCQLAKVSTTKKEKEICSDFGDFFRGARPAPYPSLPPRPRLSLPSSPPFPPPSTPLILQLVHAGATLVVLKAMGQHEAQHEVQRWGCCILATLASSDVDHAEARVAVEKAMQRHGADAGMQRWGRKALRWYGAPSAAVPGPRAARCAHCGWGAAELGFRLQRCRGCGDVLYCGRACQREHWKAGHKAQCGGLPEQRSPAEGPT